MIVFDLVCREGQHRFEGWFASSEDFARQQERGLVTCPVCGSAEVGKALMAPHLGRKGNQRSEPVAVNAPSPPPPAVTNTPPPPMPPEVAAAFRAMAQAQAEVIKKSRWVGDDFADKARAIHYGEAEPELIHGQATPEEARDLVEEGVEIAPVLFPVVPPDQAN